ncbi:MAG: BON domain-containing protein [Azoarcus sp.]|nr:BON domain-containing protein [Azoarcus sp.]
MNKAAATLILSGLLGLTSVGCAVTRDQSTVGEYVDDITITTRVKAKFAEDSTVSMMSINVETLKGTVQLSGFAKSAAERSRAGDIARATPGVRSVKNDIVLRP